MQPLSSMHPISNIIRTYLRSLHFQALEKAAFDLSFVEGAGCTRRHTSWFPTQHSHHHFILLLFIIPEDAIQTNCLLHHNPDKHLDPRRSYPLHPPPSDNHCHHR